MAADTSYRVKYDKYILYLILNTWSYVGHEKASELDVLLSRSAPPAMIFEFASGGRYWHHASPAAISTSCLQVRVAEVASLPSCLTVLLRAVSRTNPIAVGAGARVN